MKVREVRTPRDLRDFIKLPYRIYKGDKNWIPPLLKDEKKYWTAHPGLKKNPVKMFLAEEDGKPVGRLAVMIPQRYNELNQVTYARFFGLEAFDRPGVFDALFETAENWARAQGATHIHGPLGYNNLDHNGLLVEGFDWPQATVSIYNKPYYKENIERLGYAKEIDWIENRITITPEAVEKGKKGAQLVKRRFGIEAWQAADKKELEKTTESIFELYNQGYKHLAYVVPLDEEDIAFYKQAYMQVLLPEWVFFARDTKHDNKLVGMLIAMPALGDALRKAKGRLFPFGIFHILKSLRKPKEIDMGIIAVHPEYQNKGPAVAIFDRFHQVMQKYGLKVFETGGVFETNHHVLSNWKNYDAIQHKRKRVYGKDL